MLVKSIRVKQNLANVEENDKVETVLLEVESHKVFL